MNGRFDSYHLYREESDIATTASGRELPGDWMPVNNHDLLWVKYPGGGAFAHILTWAIHDFNRRSFYSAMLFLNDIPEEKVVAPILQARAIACAATLMAATDGLPDEYKTYEVSPRAGRLLVFDQRLVHEGVPPLSPHTKHIIRSDIMYQRVQPVCDSPDDTEAYTMFRKAEMLAEMGEVDQSVVLFRRALKRSPALARFMGQ